MDAGVRVLTAPPMQALRKPVTSETSDGHASCSDSEAVEPVETIATRPRADPCDLQGDLVKTEMSAFKGYAIQLDEAAHQ